jgi:hypothetical protein
MARLSTAVKASSTLARRVSALGQAVLRIATIALHLWFYWYDPHRPHSVADQG